MNKLIKAAAKSHKELWDADELADFINAATIVIAYAKSQGVEMVKVCGDADEIATEMVKDYYKNQTSPNWVSVVKQALAIGQAQGVKEMGEFAEWVSGKGLAYWKDENKWIVLHSHVSDKEEYTSAELIKEYQNREV